MKPYFEEDGITLYCGDCREVLPKLEEQFEACVCDPPYGLSFMGKDWDHGVPGSATWAEVLRVLKPGAFMLAFGGTRTYHRLACAIEDAGFEIRDGIMWLYGSGFPKHGSCLKPAWEPIIVARKSGKGLLNIDGCRINPGERVNGGGGNHGRRKGSGWDRPSDALAKSMPPHDLGRWPTNVILDEEAAAALDEQSGILTSGNNPAKRSADKHRTVYAGWKGEQCLVYRGTDSGGASRFFYTAKADSNERGTGNDHPTVKPLDLMRYLCKLICPPSGGTLVDPFLGSGSTLVAGRRFFQRCVGIDISEHYCELAANRLRQGVLALTEAESATMAAE